MTTADTAKRLAPIWDYIRKDKPKKARPDFKFPAPLEHGWLLRYLLPLEDMCWGRWQHWTKLKLRGSIGDEPIPQIEWASEHGPGSPGRRAWEVALNAVTRYGGWEGWSSYKYVDYLFDWVLFGLGHHAQNQEPQCPGSECEGCSERLYQLFNLEPMIAYPHDYLGDILAENRHGRSQGFFPTPMEICDLMVRMQMEGNDCRAKRTLDPTLGTGRMLLAASNHSYRLFGQDVSLTVIKAALINGYLYAPWLVKPFDFLQEYESAEPEAKPVPQIVAQPLLPPVTIPGKPQLEFQLV